MRFGKTLRLFVSVLLIGVSSALAQVTPDCPTISVTGPAGITLPGDWMEFTAGVSGQIPDNVTYRWSLGDEGQILQGQGTLRLRVQTPMKNSFNITATLEVQGLPRGCPNSASETAPVACRCDPILVDEFTGIPRREQMARIDTAVYELRKLSESKLFFIEYFRRRASPASIKARVKWLSDQLMRRHKFSPKDFEIITSESVDGEARTKIYIILPGTEKPYP